jgi:uncharacterized phiE125 gp8 family phage protein
MDIRYKMKTAPVFSPVSVEQLKRSLRIEHSDQDELLQDLLDAAVEESQNATGRQYARATFVAYIDGSELGAQGSGEIEIEKGPVDAIASVKYYAPGAAVLTALEPEKYQLDNSELTARLRFPESFSADAEKMNSVEIEFACGWADAASVPKDLVSAIILRASEMYLNSENGAVKYNTAAENKERNYKVQRY